MRRRGFPGRRTILLLTLIILFAGAGPGKPSRPPHKARPSRAAKPAPATVTAESWMASLSLRQKVSQMIVIPFSGHPLRPRSREAGKFMSMISREHVGGIILVNQANGRIVTRANPVETAQFINRMQKLSPIPLLVAGDFERGVSMRVDGTTIFPHAMAFAASGDPSEARTEGAVTASESRAIGFDWLLFPDADVNNNPDNPIINIRSYGEDPATVAKFAAAFIEGAHSNPDNRVLVTAKHFPGHGDTAIDTHMNLATITGDRARLEDLKWVPFRASIAAGVDAIMTAHLAVPALDDPALPATLSRKILTGALRGDLGFQGLIVTDALDMGGIAQGFSTGDAAVRAVEAGADVLLMPADPKKAIDAVVAAVKSGRISAARLDASVMRILTAKIRVGLGAGKYTDVSQLSKLVDTAANNLAAQTIADRSVTLVRDNSSLVPLNPAALPNTVFYTMIEGPESIEGAAFSAGVRRHIPGARIITADSTMPASQIDQLLERGAGASQYCIAAFASVAAKRGSAGLGGELPRLVKGLIATGKPVVFTALGNPYLLRTFPDVAAYLTTYSTVPPSETGAVKALFGEIPITGRLPVTIPGVVPRTR